MKYISDKEINMDIRPQDDFYDYATSIWREKNPLKATFSRFGRFDQLNELARRQLKSLITGLGNTPEASVPGTIDQKIWDLFSMGMDMSRRNTEGAAPLQPLIRQIENLDVNDMARSLAWMHSNVTTTLFGCAVGAGYENSDINIMHVGATGLGLGDRDYYLVENEENARILEAYRKYIVRIMTLAGFSRRDAHRVRDTVIKIETEIARNKMTREQRRNPQLSNNPTTLSQLIADYPSFNWTEYFNYRGAVPTDINLTHPAYTRFILEYIPSLSERQIKDFWIYEAISEATGLLSDDFSKASFNMFGKVMNGTKKRKTLWQRSMALPNSMFGEAVGQLYVKRFFPESHKKAMIDIVENLRDALRVHINALSWMSDVTKTRALDKLDSMGVKIGFPDKWKDYSGICIDPQKTYFENVLLASRWFIADNMAKLGKPVDKQEWFMSPQTVNAYYSPLNNEICFPAAILQPPFFNIKAAPAINYGAIGVVIGHEMTHAFDDQGRQFDKDGNLTDWWHHDDAGKFKSLADRLAAQFDEVLVLPGLHANGRYTLGENIADQGGLRIAYTALCHALGMADPPLSDRRQFYISYASIWAENIRDEAIRSRVMNDPHSLGRNRVNDTLRNIGTFMDAFNITPADAMYRSPEERVIIW